LPVYDFDGSHNPPYIVIRYLEGGTLKEVMAQGKLPLPEVTYLLRQVCSAMDYAHRQGIIHRDLKPSNILIDREGNAFGMDFGIARMAADMGGRQIIETGAIVGTPDYMAPEQIQGSNTVDQRADVYSLGIIAYEMLSNDFPFPRVEAMAMMYHHMNEIPASITEKAPELPDAVEDVMEQYELFPAQVHAAMAYYYDHKEYFDQQAQEIQPLLEQVKGESQEGRERLRAQMKNLQEKE
jgi:serine/threonine-protein kinase